MKEFYDQDSSPDEQPIIPQKDEVLPEIVQILNLYLRISPMIIVAETGAGVILEGTFREIQSKGYRFNSSTITYLVGKMK